MEHHLSELLENKLIKDENKDSLLRFLFSVFEHAPNVFFVKDQTGKYLVVNKAFEQYVGKEKSHIIGKTDFDIMPKLDAEECIKSDQPAMQCPYEINQSFEVEHGDNQQVIRYLSVNKQVIDTEFGQVLIGIATTVAM